MAKRESGVITVYLALTFTVMASLLLVMCESARTAGARVYLETAGNSAMDSLFSNYHRELWDRYRLFGLEEYSEREIEDEFLEYLHPYIGGAENRNWYALSVPAGGVTVTGKEELLSRGGKVLFDQVTEYMKYAAVTCDREIAAADSFRKLAEEGIALKEAASELSGASEMVLEMEDLLERIRNLSGSVGKEYTDLERAAAGYDLAEFEKAAAALESTVTSAEKAAGSYERIAAKFSEELDRIEQDISGKRDSAGISEESYRALQEEMEQYRRYADGAGETGEKIRSFSKTAGSFREELKNACRLASGADEEAHDYESTSAAAGNRAPAPGTPGGEGPGGTTAGAEQPPGAEMAAPDLSEIWAETIRFVGSMEVPSADLPDGKKDREKENALLRARDLLSGGLLELVLPEGVTVSEELYDLTGAPSAGTSPFTGPAGLPEIILLSEYLDAYFTHYRPDGGLPLQAEYILYGGGSDRENLGSFAGEYETVYTGINFLSLLSDSKKRNEARSLAAVICGAPGTPVAEAVKLLILTTWAACQAAADLKTLLSGERVPLCRSGPEFTVSVQGILSGNFTKERGAGSEGMSYENFLKLFSLWKPAGEETLRIADVIRTDLQKEQEDFSFSRLYAVLELSVDCTTDHLFSGNTGARYACTFSRGY